MKSTLRSTSRSRAAWLWQTPAAQTRALARSSSLSGTPDYLTGMYTIFGQVVSGQEVADKISQVPTVPGDKPLVPVILKTVTIQRKQ